MRYVRFPVGVLPSLHIYTLIFIFFLRFINLGGGVNHQSFLCKQDFQLLYFSISSTMNLWLVIEAIISSNDLFFCFYILDIIIGIIV